MLQTTNVSVTRLDNVVSHSAILNSSRYRALAGRQSVQVTHDLTDTRRRTSMCTQPTRRPPPPCAAPLRCALTLPRRPPHDGASAVRTAGRLARGQNSATMRRLRYPRLANASLKVFDGRITAEALAGSGW